MDLLRPEIQNQLDYNNWYLRWFPRSWNLSTLLLLMSRTYDNSVLVRTQKPDCVEQAELMDIWVGSICKGTYDIVQGPTPNEVDVLFELDEDAVLFNLRWL